MLFSAVGMSRSFRCFSEYEYSWWDGQGQKHVNAFSMSHFQLKARAAFSEERTNRYPIKEAYFISRLHPTYRESLLNHCPHAMITAHLIVSIVEPERDDAVSHYQLALKILNEAERIHQEVTFYAWPLQAAITRAEQLIRARSGALRGINNVTLVLSSETLGIVKSLLPRLASQFRSLHVIGADSTVMSGMEPIPGIRFSGLARGENVTDCMLRISLLSQLEKDSFPAIVLLDASDLALPLVEQYLTLITASDFSPPMFLSFGLKRAMPRIINSSFLVKGAYNSANFAIRSKSLINEHLHTAVSICQIDSTDYAWDQLSRPASTGFHTPLRCDDDRLPFSLRLCLGDEHTRNDWRNTVLAPVVPRHPVKPY